MVWNGRITTWWGPQLPQSAMEENRLSVMTGWVLDFSDSTFRGIKIAKSISLILWMVHTAKILTKCRCKWVTVSHDFRVNCLTLLPCAIKTALLGSKSKSNIFSIMQIVQRSKLGKMSWYDLVCIEICDASPDRRWQFLSLWERSFVLLCIVYDLMVFILDNRDAVSNCWPLWLAWFWSWCSSRRLGTCQLQEGW